MVRGEQLGRCLSFWIGEQQKKLFLHWELLKSKPINYQTLSSRVLLEKIIAV